MAGHSKWANTKHRKERADAKRGKIFTRVTKEIINAVKSGGADPKLNSKLRAAIQKAKEANLPNENIERNIKRAQSADQEAYHEFVYELYGYGGVGILAWGLTDNRNRLSSDMRIATNKRGGSVASPGSVAFNFSHVVWFELPCPVEKQEELFLIAGEAGAEDITFSEEEAATIVGPAEIYGALHSALKEGDYTVSSSEITYVPIAEVECSPEDMAANQALFEWLEGIDDVEEIAHNMA